MAKLMTNEAFYLCNFCATSSSYLAVILCSLVETKIGHLVYANGRLGSTVVTITLLFTFIMILLTVCLPTHLEQTKSVCAIIYLYVKKKKMYFA
jgi:hypothetical protein